MTRGPHVCALIQYFEIGGIERMVLDIATCAVERQIQTTVVAYLGEGRFRDTFEHAGIQTQFIDGRAGLQLTLPWTLGRWLRRNRVDVLHSHHLGPFIYGAAAAWMSRIPQLHTEHSRELYDTPRRQLIGRAMPRMARVVTVAEELSRWRSEHFDDRCEAIPNGVFVPERIPPAEPARAELGLAPDAFVIGCVARLGKEKDHRTLVEAFRRVRIAAPRARLVLVGDGPERAALEENAPEGMTLLGTRNDVQSLLPAFDVIALSSRREGLPLALLEGMAFGLPAVATSVGGIPELLADGAGQVVPVASPELLAEALLNYAHDPVRREADGRTARARVLEHHDRRAMVARYSALYRELAGV